MTPPIKLPTPLSTWQATLQVWATTLRKLNPPSDEVFTTFSNAVSDAIAYGGIFWCGNALGSGDEIVLLPTIKIPSLVDGTALAFRVIADNTTQVFITLLDERHGVRDADGVTTLVPGSLRKGQLAAVRYNLTSQNWTLISNGAVVPRDGWMLLTESWSYASASTITIPAGGTSRFAKGDKIKITNSGTKYFNIIGVTSTTLTVTGGSDYTVANASIDAIWLSREESPVGFPQFFNYTPVFTGFATAPVVNARFCVRGTECYTGVLTTAAGSSGGGAPTTFTVSAAVPAQSAVSMNYTSYGQATDGAPVYDGIALVTIGTGQSSFTIKRKAGDGTAWTATGPKYCDFCARHEI